MPTDVLTASARPDQAAARLRRLAAWTVVATALYLRWRHSGSWNFVDLTDFYYGGVSVLEGTDLYAPHPGVLAFNYPPFAGVAFLPLAVMGLTGAKAAFTAATFAAYGVSLLAVKRATGLAWATVFLVGALGLSLEPVVRTLVLGQIGVILMAVVLADLFLLPPRYRGLLIGLAAGVKLTPALFVVYLVLRRDWASVLRAGAAGVGTIAVGWVAAPLSSQRYWLGGFDKLDRFGDLAFTPVNQSVTSLVARTTGHGSGLLLWAAEGLVVALVATTAVVVARRGAWTVLALVLAGATLLLSPISWTHHWVWVVPTLAVLVRARRGLISVVVAAVFYVGPMWLVPEHGTPSAVQLSLAYAYLVVCLALMVATLAAHGRHRAFPSRSR